MFCKKIFNLVPPIFFVLTMLSVCMSFFFKTQAHFRLDFFMEANNMHADQIAYASYEQSDPGSYCLQFWLPENVSSREEQITKVVTGGKRFNKLYKTPI